VSKGLQAEGIETDFVPIAGETRTNVVITDAEGHRHVKVNEAGPCVTPAEAAAFLDRAEARMRADDLWVLCGSLPPGLPDGFYADLTERVAQRGARVLLDASGEPLRQGCAAGPFLVKPNEVEIEQVTGIPVRSDTDARRAVEHLRRSVSTRVALTLGAGGMLLADNAQIIWAHPPHITARNAVGAGDALMAGLAWGISQGLPSSEVARWGVAAGSASAARAGVAIFSRAELETMAERVSVESERTTEAR
jgi:1-phosphofructokinase family hexose kinase